MSHRTKAGIYLPASANAKRIHAQGKAQAAVRRLKREEERRLARQNRTNAQRCAIRKRNRKQARRLRRARRQGRRGFGLNLGNLGRVGAVMAILWFGGLALVAGSIFTLVIMRMFG
jgi:hypothetical protein